MKTMGIAAGALALVTALPALAQTENTTPPASRMDEAADLANAPVRAPRGAIELGVDAGFTRGFGSIQGRRGVNEAAGAGAMVGASLGVRLNPRWSLSVSGQYQGYASGTTAPREGVVRGAAASVQATFHGSPYSRVDPWLSFGAGYRALMERATAEAPMTITHGVELGRVEVGVDVRASESVSISPVIGADVNMFTWRSGGGAETATLTDRALNGFIFAGVKGRFDVGGTREPKPAPVEVGDR